MCDVTYWSVSYMNLEVMVDILRFEKYWQQFSLYFILHTILTARFCRTDTNETPLQCSCCNCIKHVAINCWEICILQQTFAEFPKLLLHFLHKLVLWIPHLSSQQSKCTEGKNLTLTPVNLRNILCWRDNILCLILIRI